MRLGLLTCALKGPTMSERRIGLMRMTLAAFRETMSLPADVTLTHAFQDWRDVQNESATFRLEGEGLPHVKAGERIPEVQAIFKSTAEGVEFLHFERIDDE